MGSNEKKDVRRERPAGHTTGNIHDAIREGDAVLARRRGLRIGETDALPPQRTNG